jgi:hypothetical protein
LFARANIFLRPHRLRGGSRERFRCRRRARRPQLSSATIASSVAGADELFSLTVMFPNVQPGRIGWLTGHGQKGNELPKGLAGAATDCSSKTAEYGPTLPPFPDTRGNPKFTGCARQVRRSRSFSRERIERWRGAAINSLSSRNQGTDLLRSRKSSRTDLEQSAARRSAPSL